MRRIFFLVIILQVLCFTNVKAQSIINLSLRQNPLFGVSTNSVSAALDGTPLTLGADIVITGGSGNYTYRWYTTAGELSTSSTITVDKAGEYLLDITDECDCLQTVAFNITGSTAISTVAADAVKQTLVIGIDGTLLGVANGNTIDTAALPAGTYIIQRVATDGSVSARKFVKK